MKRVQTHDPQQAIYRKGPYLVIALPVTVLGLSGIVVTAEKAIREWPTDDWGISLAWAVLVAIGLGLMGFSQIVFDKSAGRVSKLWRWLFVRRSTTLPLERFNRVSWKLERGGDSAVYPVTLKGPEGQELRLFEETSIDDARRTTHELALFLGFGEEHWDTTFLSREARQVRERLAKAQRSNPLNAFARAVARLVIPRITLRIEGATSNVLAYRKGFGKIQRFFGLFALSMGVLSMGVLSKGVLFLLSLLLETEVNAGEHPWVVPLVGGISATVGVVLVFWRRGMNIDMNAGSVTFWWGLLRPMWSTHHDVSRFTTLVLQPEAKESGSVPNVWWRVSLSGEGVEKLTLFGSSDLDEARTFAEQVADFLKYPLLELAYEGH